jgi:hypothetical protein
MAAMRIMDAAHGTALKGSVPFVVCAQAHRRAVAAIATTQNKGWFHGTDAIFAM